MTHEVTLEATGGDSVHQSSDSRRGNQAGQNIVALVRVCVWVRASEKNRHSENVRVGARSRHTWRVMRALPHRKTSSAKVAKVAGAEMQSPCSPNSHTPVEEVDGSETVRV